MPKKSDGSGTIYKRGEIWWVKIRVDGRPVYESSKSTKKADAIRLRDKLLAKRHRGEITGGAPDRVLVSELLDDLLKSDIKPSTKYVWEKVIEKNVRPFFGKLKAQRLSTDQMDTYREKRKAEGRSDSTANRELSILRTAFHNARKRTPPKVNQVPYFPMIQETTVRKGFLTDEQYATLLRELPAELKALFVTAYMTGMRKGELTPIQWPQVDFEAGLITLDKGATKNDDARSVPILAGDMYDLLSTAKRERDAGWPDCPWVFNRAGVPQVVRMKISGHKTDPMERRYNIVDAEDMSIAKELLERRLSVTKTVTSERESAKLGDTDKPIKSTA
jgi:integrase